MCGSICSQAEKRSNAHYYQVGSKKITRENGDWFDSNPQSTCNNDHSAKNDGCKTRDLLRV